MIRERFISFRHAFRGIGIMLLSQPHARFHLVASITVLTAARIFGCTTAEYAILFLAIGMVFAAEAGNSALETLADKVCRQKDPLIRDAKDLAAGAVLLTALSAIGVAFVIFTPKLIDCLL